MIDRREVLSTAGSWAALAGVLRMATASSGALAQAAPPAINPADAGEPITPDHVQKLAQQLATRPYAKPKIDVPEPFNKLTVEQYRDIRYRREQAIWKGDKLDYELQMFPMGWLYDVPVEVWLVDGGRARALKADGSGSPASASTGRSTAPTISTNISCSRGRAISARSHAARIMGCQRVDLPSTPRVPVARKSRCSAASGSRSLNQVLPRLWYTPCSTAPR
jgi:Periplasmic glucan biosynthesis protein, MdoG